MKYKFHPDFHGCPVIRFFACRKRSRSIMHTSGMEDITEARSATRLTHAFDVIATSYSCCFVSAVEFAIFPNIDSNRRATAPREGANRASSYANCEELRWGYTLVYLHISRIIVQQKDLLRGAKDGWVWRGGGRRKGLKGM